LRVPCSSRPECMNHDHAGILCITCYNLNAKKTRLIVRPGPKKETTLRVCPKCLTRPTGHTSWRYCAQCRAYLKSQPGPKCRRCRLHPAPEQYKSCTHCREHDRLAQRARTAKRQLAVFQKLSQE
jgi:hypothetical protein